MDNGGSCCRDPVIDNQGCACFSLRGGEDEKWICNSTTENATNGNIEIHHKTWYNKHMGRKPKKHPGGRPTDYKPEYAQQAYKLCLLGYTDDKLADFFGVCRATVSTWKLKHPEFLDGTSRGKELADANVAEGLYQRAIGYEHPEDKIFNNNGEALVVETIKHYPPDTAAARLWLEARQRTLWKQKQEIEHSGGIISAEIPLDPKDEEQYRNNLKAVFGGFYDGGGNQPNTGNDQEPDESDPEHGEDADGDNGE